MPERNQVVYGKLRDHLAPYIITAQRLGKWRPYTIYTTYSYLGEVFVLLAGMGVAHPVFAAFAGKGSGAEVSSTGPPSSAVGLISICLFLIWGLVKYYIRSEDLERKCSTLRKCRADFRSYEHRMRKALAEPLPMPALTELHREIGSLVDRQISEDVWPYPGPEPGISEIVIEFCNQLEREFGHIWVAAPPQERSRPIAAGGSENG
jgi:hypothetical protein